MVRVRELTSEALLSAPRRSPPVPNRDGTRALYTVTSTTLGYKTTKDLRVLNLETGSSLYLCNDDRDHDAAWIPGTRYDVIWLRSVDGGKTHVMVANAVNMRIDHYAIAVIPAPVSNLKLHDLGDGRVAFVVTGLVGDAGLYNQEVAQKGSAARIYDAEIPIVSSPNCLYSQHMSSLVASRVLLHLESCSCIESCSCTESRPCISSLVVFPTNRSPANRCLSSGMNPAGPTEAASGTTSSSAAPAAGHSRAS